MSYWSKRFFSVVSMWFKFDSDYVQQISNALPTQVDPRLWTVGDATSYRFQVAVAGYTNSYGKYVSYYRLRLRTVNAAAPKEVVMGAFNSPDKWTFVAFSYSSALSKMFFLVDTDVLWSSTFVDHEFAAEPIKAYTTRFAIGNDVEPSRIFPGVIDEFYVYSRYAGVHEARVSLHCWLCLALCSPHAHGSCCASAPSFTCRAFCRWTTWLAAPPTASWRAATTPQQSLAACLGLVCLLARGMRHHRPLRCKIGAWCCRQRCCFSTRSRCR